ncbi:MAG: ABC-2 type transport system ATP-binding protein [Planctomycetota bacterium]|jgi:ABC-2 type transport system ATP-binding protein
MSTIRVQNLFKRYGHFEVLKHINFEVEQGETVGLLGENGAGKTTTMRILSCFIPPTVGTVEVAGHEVVFASKEVRRNIGYMPESVPVYGSMRVGEYLDFRARLKGLRAKEAKAGVDKALSLVDLTARRRSLISTLSKGLRQRVGLADALVHDPSILILDEPTSGLDPGQRREVRKLIQSLRSERTVLLSTHILPEVESTCDRVIVIHGGKVLAQKSIAELKSRDDVDNFSIRGRGDLENTLRHLEAIDDMTVLDSQDVGEGLIELSCQSEDKKDGRARTVASLVTSGLGIQEVSGRDVSLEEVFLKLIKDDEGKTA